MHCRLLSICVIVLISAFGASAAVVFDPVPPLPQGLAGVETTFALVGVSTADEIGPMPRPQSDVSQGAETGDPNYYIEMSPMLGAMGGRLVRCDPFSDVTKLKVTEDGKLQIDFSAADAICDALARAGAKPCWNIATFPVGMMGPGDRPKPELLDSFIYQVTYHWNVEQKRGIQYYEYLNEPGGFDGERFEVVARAAHRADPSVKVGGPAVMGCPLETLENTATYCIERNIGLGFLSFHLYYEMPDGYLEYVEKVEQILDKYPETKGTEILLTEWGVDAGLNGSCDTLYNAAYYSTILQTVMHKWPRVHPMHFEFRDGWDGIGPSRDLWGRWGMVTYPNLLPKPVYNAGVMWNMMAGTEVKTACADERVRVIAAKDPHQVTLLIWSWPKQYQKLLADAPSMKSSTIDIPLKVIVDKLPFDSQGVRYQRYVVDQTHSNVGFDPYTADLQKVQDTILARTGPERGDEPTKGLPDDSFQAELVLPLHAVTLIVLRPEDRPPVNVVAEADRFGVWAGEKARVTIKPRFTEDLDLELITDPANRGQWSIEPISNSPLSFHVQAPASDVKSTRYFTAWVRNRKSGAIGRACLEFLTDSPARLSLKPDHIDVSPVTRKGRAVVDVVNKTPEARDVEVRWSTPTGVHVSPASRQVNLAPNQTLAVGVDVTFDAAVAPGQYPITADLLGGCDLGSLRAPVNLSLQCPMLKKPIVLDGDLSEWERAPSVKVASAADFDGHSYREWGGDSDICGRIWTAWDKDNLYLAFRVMDNEHVQKLTTWEMKDFDSVHVGFDLRRDSTNPKEFFDDSDCDYVFGLMDGKGYAYRHWGAKRSMGVSDGVRIAAKRTGAITTYEVSMNWKSEFVPYANPEVGEVIGCSVYFRDYDEGVHKAEMRWGRGLAWDEKRPALFSSLWLTK